METSDSEVPTSSEVVPAFRAGAAAPPGVVPVAWEEMLKPPQAVAVRIGGSPAGRREGTELLAQAADDSREPARAQTTSQTEGEV